MTTRREFMKKAGMAAGAAALFSQFPLTACGRKGAGPGDFGFQVWTIREELLNDFPGTLEKMAGMGYAEVEMCSPLGYSNAGFDVLNDMSGEEMKKVIDATGLKCTSSHFNLGELRDHLDNRIEWAHGLGIKQMILASFWLPKDASLDDYRKAADELNEIGEKTKAEGLQMGFHNHHMEFQKRDGQLIYEVLLDQFDPELVKMQFQVAVVNIGYEAADFFREYPGRFISTHLSDYAEDMETQVPLGQGIVDWEEFFRAAGTGGVKNFFVEMNPDFFESGAEFLARASR